MNQNKIRSNPFDFVKASDFSDEQIQQYWVDLAGDGLEGLFKPKSPLPMLLLGGKGSGKTHLMRYFSTAVHKIRFGGDLLKAIQTDGYMGIYVRADALNVGRFDGKGVEGDVWAEIFSYYFELWLTSNLLKNIQECIKKSTIVFPEEAFVIETKKLFSSSQPAHNTILTLQALIDYLAELRKKIDHIVGNIATRRTDIKEVEILLSRGAFVFGIPDILDKHSELFKNTLFVYMVDEIENFTVYQQKFLNSLIRYHTTRTSIKVGARLYGIRTNKTLDGTEEENREGSEFEKIELDAWLRKQESKYYDLACKLIVKRLEQADLLPPNSPTERALVARYFEELDGQNHYQSPTLALVKKYDESNRERPYFDQLKEKIMQYGAFKNRAQAQSISEEAISFLKIKQFPLLEKVNLHLFYQGWSKETDLIKIATEIKAKAELFVQGGRETASSYYEVLDHFKFDFLAQLYRDCEQPKIVYAGIDTLINLSQGVPRNLLGLLKHIYRYAQFEGDKPFQKEGLITINSQIKGIHDAAAWFWSDAQPDSHGPEVRKAVEHLAEFFSRVRYSVKPAECKLAAFTVNWENTSKTAQEVLKHAENWSYIIHIPTAGSDRNNTNSVDNKFQISPMLAPRWQISEHIRGALKLQPALFNAIFDANYREQLDELIKERLKGMEEPYSKQATKNDQGTLL